MLSKSQIDKIGDKLRSGHIDAGVLRSLNEFRRSCLPLYEELNFYCSMRLGLEPTGRAQKSTAAIIGKLKRESIRLSQVQDIAGLRVIVSDLIEQDRVIRSACSDLSKIVVDDKRERPTNAYRAVHLICHRDGRSVELQVRTRSQHAWAELSEKFADHAGQELKYGQGNQDLLDFLARLSSLGWQLETVRRDYRLLVTNASRLLDKRSLKRDRKHLREKEAKVLLAIRQLFHEARRRAARGDR